MIRKWKLLPVLLPVLGCGGPPPQPQEPVGAAAQDVVRIEATVSKVLENTRQAVIDAGRRQGVFVGMVFEIRRKERVIGRVQASMLWDDECGGWITERYAPFEKGDRAIAEVKPGAGPAPGGDPIRGGSTGLKPGTICTRVIGVQGEGSETGRAGLEAGSDAGVKPGMVFNIYDRDEYVGRVKVTLVKPEVSGADVIESRKPFKEGFLALHEPPEKPASGPEADPGSQVDPAEMIRRLEARISDPKTSKEDRQAARDVLRRLRAEQDAKSRRSGPQPEPKPEPGDKGQDKPEPPAGG